MTDIPRQVEHTPEVQAFLDKLAAFLPAPVEEDQKIRNPECAVEAGSVQCLNAASDICDNCEWWLGVGEDDD